MAENNLFPAFNVPAMLTDEPEQNIVKYKKSWFFDYETGDFVKDGGNRVKECDGWTAWTQWCMKTVRTIRYACLAYDGDMGIEDEDVRRQPTRKAAESAFERTITEALLADPRTESVRNFSFDWKGDILHASFDVFPRIGASVTLQAEIKV
jgi:hypothetical protein